MKKPIKRLVRSTKDRKLAGVCGGLAQYFEVDPTVVRVIFVLLGLPGGAPGIIVYVLLWLVMPEK